MNAPVLQYFKWNNTSIIFYVSKKKTTFLQQLNISIPTGLAELKTALGKLEDFIISCIERKPQYLFIIPLPNMRNRNRNNRIDSSYTFYII